MGKLMTVAVEQALKALSKGGTPTALAKAARAVLKVAKRVR